MCVRMLYIRTRYIPLVRWINFGRIQKIGNLVQKRWFDCPVPSGPVFANFFLLTTDGKSMASPGFPDKRYCTVWIFHRFTKFTNLAIGGENGRSMVNHRLCALYLRDAYKKFQEEWIFAFHRWQTISNFSHWFAIGDNAKKNLQIPALNDKYFRFIHRLVRAVFEPRMGFFCNRKAWQKAQKNTQRTFLT